ncbi:Putative hydroxypyruvate isomerase YgbM [bacterium HR36]|uniref:Xylose isomerase domain-containing protein n=1 Tax=uncultured Planctomycetota bacterium TaxID=120965 RepID=H5SCU7_9BACT|nr:xylose isomerase domain-containing protein [uncultured Planctomycetota bacterium]BAL57161.1 xylose isomerase domain-containing protein [uncultured Planctomycetota bacterium]GBD35693.1 Putative hydroxypyruvate isomerase YgbM [bacterium HR36]
MSWKLAFSANAFLRCSLPEAARRIRAAGYAGIEILADVPHAWPVFLLEEQKQAIRRALAENGLAISNVNAFMMNAVADARQPYWHPSWIEPDRHYRQVRIDHTLRALSLAKELGAPSISTEPGGPLEPGQAWQEALDLFLESLAPVAEQAERLGVQLLVEPEPGLLLETAAQFEEFMDRVASPAVGLNCDIGHFFCVGEDPAEVIRRLARYIRHVHLEDIPSDRRHQHLIPGEGAISFLSVFEALYEIGYRGWVTVELYPYLDNPDHAARTAFERIQPLLAKFKS